jgi:hypothetical protein
MVGTSFLSNVLLSSLGTSGENEPLYGGVIIFVIVGVSMLYLAYIRTEMDAGRIVKIIGFVSLAFALLALSWPMRPW